MKAVIAIDSFKGSLSTIEAGNAAKEGILRVYRDAEVTVLPLADGGEGTVEAVVYGGQGEFRDIFVTGPLGVPVMARYGIADGGKTAVIEMAAAAGITLVPTEKRDPLYTTTYGVGEMIRDAMDRGCRRFVIGIGGSATNDGGIGMLSALGFRFLNAEGAPVAHGAIALRDVVAIDVGEADVRLGECDFRIACDVTNPLTGERGCSAIYGPQKGATEKTIPLMDVWLMRYAALTRDAFPDADPDYPGAGAAGGMGFAFLAYLKGRLLPGIDLVTEQIRLEDFVRDADVVVTGEGRLDGQSVMGKAPIGVARVAKRHQKTVIALAGCITPDAVLCNEYGIDAFFPILPTPMTLIDAMNINNASRNLANTAEQAFRLIKQAKQIYM